MFLNAPGQLSNNNDDGNLNYDKGEITQAVGRLTSDVSLSWKKLSLFARGYFFYDTENRGRQNFYPNIQTPATTTAPGQLRRGTGEAASRDRGKLSFREETDAVDDQVGTDFQLLDANVTGNFPFVGDRDITVKLGRQSINWGESTLLIVNSLNTFNPPNANNLFRPAFLDLAEVLEPIGAVSVATRLTDSLGLEAFYQYDWEPLELPAPGSYLSFVDVGSDNARDYNRFLCRQLSQPNGFATDFSWGYRLIGIFRYDNVFPGISFENTLIWAHDIDGVAPGPGENFIEGRKNLIANMEARFGPGWSLALGYAGFYGAGEHNLLRDRDFVQTGVRYRF